MLLLLLGTTAQAAILFLVSVSAGSIGGLPITTGAVDTTGANFLAGGIGWYVAATGGVDSLMTDSKSNSYTKLNVSSSGSPESAISFATGTVGTGHTFTASSPSNDDYPAICVMAFSGVSAVLDQQNIHAGGVVGPGPNQVQTGSITPSDNNEVVIAIASNGGTVATAVDSGFTLAESVAYSGGNHLPIACAYQIQTTATAVNPLFTFAINTTYATASIASFRSSAASTHIPMPQIFGSPPRRPRLISSYSR